MYARAVADNDAEVVPRLPRAAARGTRARSRPCSFPRAELLAAVKLGTVRGDRSVREGPSADEHRPGDLGGAEGRARQRARRRGASRAPSRRSTTSPGATRRATSTRRSRRHATPSSRPRSTATRSRPRPSPPPSSRSCSGSSPGRRRRARRSRSASIGSSKTIDKADAAVQKHRMFRGVVSDPSRYFDAAHAKPTKTRSRRDRAALRARLSHRDPRARGRGADLRSRRAAPGADHGPDALHRARPVVERLRGRRARTRAASSSGSRCRSARLFRVPDDTKPLKVRLDVWKGPDMASAKEDDKPEETDLREDARGCFDQFQKKLLGAFFKPAKMTARPVAALAALAAASLTSRLRSGARRRRAPPPPQPAPRTVHRVVVGHRPRWSSLPATASAGRKAPDGLTDASPPIRDAHRRKRTRTVACSSSTSARPGASRASASTTPSNKGSSTPRSLASRSSPSTLDRDAEALATAGYVSRLIPLFAIPKQRRARLGQADRGLGEGRGARSARSRRGSARSSRAAPDGGGSRARPRAEARPITS